MKYKEAIRQLLEIEEREQQKIKLFDVETLYKAEMIKRVDLRSHGARLISKTLMEGVLKEMDRWIIKVCEGIGWSPDACEKARQECKGSATTAMRLAINMRLAIKVKGRR